MLTTITALKKADQFLILLHEHTDRAVPEWDEAHDVLHWVPSEHRERIQHTGEYLLVGGGGDRSALNSLVRKGLAVFITNTQGYAITEEGRKRATALLS